MLAMYAKGQGAFVFNKPSSQAQAHSQTDEEFSKAPSKRPPGNTIPFDRSKA